MKLLNFERFATFALSLVLAVSFMPSVAFAGVTTSDSSQTFNDMPNNWATASLNSAVENGLLKGYKVADGMEIRPNGNITRAEMATVVNRAFGATAEESLSGVADVPSGKWYASEIAKAIGMQTMTKAANMRPDDKVTRQEAFTILARAYKQAGGSNADLAKFADAASVASWAVDGLGALVKNGYVSGNGATLNPAGYMTRAEFAKIMDNLTAAYVNTTEKYSQDVNGNVIVNVAGAKLENMKISGNLIIAEGVGEGDVDINDVQIGGDIIVKAGGENSIHFYNVNVDGKLEVTRIDGVVRVVASGATNIPSLHVGGYGVVIDVRDLEGGKIGRVSVNDRPNNNETITVVLHGDFEEVVAWDDVTNIVADGKISQLITYGNVTVTGGAEIEKVENKSFENISVNGKTVESGKSISINATNAVANTGGSTGGGSSSGGGSTGGGSSSGGESTGGVGNTTPGGITDGGSTPGGITDGGSTPGGITDGGSTPGGITGGNEMPTSITSAESLTTALTQAGNKYSNTGATSVISIGDSEITGTNFIVPTGVTLQSNAHFKPQKLTLRGGCICGTLDNNTTKVLLDGINTSVVSGSIAVESIEVKAGATGIISTGSALAECVNGITVNGILQNYTDISDCNITISEGAIINRGHISIDENREMFIFGGTLTSRENPLNVSGAGSELKIDNSGVIEGRVKATDDATIIMSSGAIALSENYVGGIDGEATLSLYNATAYISGGLIKHEGFDFVNYVHTDRPGRECAVYAENSIVNITGGDIESWYGRSIFAQDSDLSISGGRIWGYNDGIVANRCEVLIEDGIIQLGTIDTDSACLSVRDTTGSGVTVKGGEFSAQFGNYIELEKAIIITSFESNAVINIEGGTLLGTVMVNPNSTLNIGKVIIDEETGEKRLSGNAYIKSSDECIKAISGCKINFYAGKVETTSEDQSENDYNYNGDGNGYALSAEAYIHVSNAMKKRTELFLIEDAEIRSLVASSHKALAKSPGGLMFSANFVFENPDNFVDDDGFYAISVSPQTY